MVGLLLSSSAHKQDSHPVVPTLLMDFFVLPLIALSNHGTITVGFLS